MSTVHDPATCLVCSRAEYDSIHHRVPLVPSVPPVIRVLGKRYTVEPVIDSAEGVARGAGYHSVGNALIAPGRIRYRVAGNEISPDEEADTILHELLHVVWATSGLRPGGKHQEERVVNRMAPVLLDALRQNPELVAYLVQEAPLNAKEKEA